MEESLRNTHIHRTHHPTPQPSIPCGDLGAFSSACSCITAVSDAYVTTVTVTPATTTATEEVRVTATSTVTVLETVWVTDVLTSKTTTTVGTLTQYTTSTSTVTETVVATAWKGYWKISNRPWYIIYDPDTQLTTYIENTMDQLLGIPLAGGQPYLVDQPDIKLFAAQRPEEESQGPRFYFLPTSQDTNMTVIYNVTREARYNDQRTVKCSVPDWQGYRLYEFVVCPRAEKSIGMAPSIDIGIWCLLMFP